MVTTPAARRRLCGPALSAVVTLVLICAAFAGSARAKTRAVHKIQCGGSSSCTASQHTITVVNYCRYPVWVGESANIVGGNVIGGKACTTTSDCGVTLADGTVDTNGVNCVNGFCSQIDCTSNSDCSNPAGDPALTSCNVPIGVTCASDSDCSTFSCTTNSDCPPGATCSGNGVCTGMCQSGTCACSSKSGCPGAGTICDTGNSGSSFGFCQGGACQYTPVAPVSDSSWKVDPKKSATLCMPQGWGGRLWGRTGCTATTGCKSGDCLHCQTGQCGVPGELECSNPALGIAYGANGATLFEPTLDSNQTDFWDISNGSGYNIPMVATACGSNGASVTCSLSGQSASGPLPLGNGVGCTRGDLNRTCPELLRVPGACNCATDADCGKVKGSCVNNLCTNRQCTVECTDPYDLCTAGAGTYAASPPLTAPSCLQCSTTVNSVTGVTYEQEYGCVGPLGGISCNNGAWVCFSDEDCPILAGHTAQTCRNNICTPVSSADSFALCSGGKCPAGVQDPSDYGCQQIGKQDLCLPNAPSSPSQPGCCGPYSSDWKKAANAAGGESESGQCESGSQPYTAAFKEACPNAYSFAYDDPSSSYQCTDTSTQEVNYLITFCPPTALRGKRPEPRPGRGHDDHGDKGEEEALR